jgi:crossover junction endodeoxyribonuclease RusA
MDLLKFELPYPPSINHYYLRTSSGVMIGAKGRKYRHDVALLLSKYRDFYSDKRLHVVIDAYPPDKRKRDIDNILKCSIDSMQHARLFYDDNQIDKLTVIRRHSIEFGRLEVSVSECCSSE